MKERASDIFPFAIAVVLPPAGIVLGLIATQQDQELGLRIIGVAVLAIVAWVLLLTL